MSGVEPNGGVGEAIIMHAMKNNTFKLWLSFSILIRAICVASTVGCTSDPCEDYRVQIRKAQAEIWKDSSTKQEKAASKEKFIELIEEALENGCNVSEFQ